MSSSPAQIAAESYHAYASTRFYLRSTPCEPAEWLKRAMLLQATAAAAAAAVDGTKDAQDAEAAVNPAPPSAVFIKLESEQRTGSFKARGALNAVLRALRDTKSSTAVEGFTTASTGNHALATIFAVGQAASLVSSPLELRIFVAQNADPTKLARLHAAAEASNGRCSVVVEGRDCCEAEKAARRAAAERKGLRYLSPYNDADVIAGQGSLAVELLSQLRGGGGRGGRQGRRGGDNENDDPPLAVFVPVGGGGLIAGVAAVLKSALDSPGRCTVYGCQPAANDVMRRSVEEGRLLELPSVAEAPTLSDATAGGVEQGSLTFPICRNLVDHWVTLSESEIAEGVVSCLEHGGKLIEGAAGCAVAAALKVGRERPEELAGRTVVVIACGGNVGVAALKEALELGKALEV
jgi:threonine dehydratase